MESPIVETWNMSNEVNLYLLSNIPEDHLADKYSARTRNVGRQFAHIHNVRVRWLNHFDPKGKGENTVFSRGVQPAKNELAHAIEASGKSMALFLEGIEIKGKIKSWNSTPLSFLGYMIAHEAHHRGLIMTALRISGHKPTQEVVYGQWRWGKKY